MERGVASIMRSQCWYYGVDHAIVDRTCFTYFYRSWDLFNRNWNWLDGKYLHSFPDRRSFSFQNDWSLSKTIVRLMPITSWIIFFFSSAEQRDRSIWTHMNRTPYFFHKKMGLAREALLFTVYRKDTIDADFLCQNVSITSRICPIRAINCRVVCNSCVLQECLNRIWTTTFSFSLQVRLFWSALMAFRLCAHPSSPQFLKHGSINFQPIL